MSARSYDRTRYRFPKHSFPQTLALVLTFVLAPILSVLASSSAITLQNGLHAQTIQEPECVELVQNGGFEQDVAWIRPRTPIQAQYVGAPGFPQGGRPHTGQRAMRLGTTIPTPRASYSSIRQRIQIPATAKVVTLEFWVWLSSQDTNGGDRQEAYLLNPMTGRVMVRLWRVAPAQHAPKWELIRVDLTPYAGKEVLLYFNAYNDGDSGPTAIFLDDVHMTACSSLRPTPTPTVTLRPSPTPTPTFTKKPVTPTSTPSPHALASTQPAPPTAAEKQTGTLVPYKPAQETQQQKTRFGLNREMLVLALYTFGFTLALIVVAILIARTIRQRVSRYS